MIADTPESFAQELAAERAPAPPPAGYTSTDPRLAWAEITFSMPLAFWRWALAFTPFAVAAP